MPLDAICLMAISDELSELISAMIIDKIQQPERDVIILSLRGDGGKTLRLLLSAGADDARIHLTDFKFDNPKEPPMFCMLLRKYITGARITKITQPPAERVLTLELDTTGALGIRSVMHLSIEMIGRLSNIILIDNDGIIVDCMRRIGGDLTGKRSVLPGLIYTDPPPQTGKRNPLSVTDAQLRELLKSACSNTADKWLITTFTAFSPLICREIAWRAYGETAYFIDAIKDDGDAMVNAFTDLIGQVKSKAFEPWMIMTNDGKLYDFSYTHIGQYENKCKAQRVDGFSNMLDLFYTRSAQEKRIGQRSASTLKLLENTQRRLIRKLAAQRNELDETKKLHYLRECGDIITSNMHLIKKGQQSLSAEDFYSESKKIRVIKLDPLKTPQHNAAKYYKAYTKAKNAGKILTQQIPKGETELKYIESVIEQIKRVDSEQDLNEIRSELLVTGYIKPQKLTKTRKTESAPISFTSTNGMRIYAGRNNIQNDKLTLKTASKSDIWLHAQKIHGAHVIISSAGKLPDEKTLQEAASIAAYYSAARRDLKVPVDYTPVKKVKKPSGGRPGMVIYDDYKTILTTPDEELVNRLRDSS